MANWFGPDQPYTRDEVADSFAVFALRLVGAAEPDRPARRKPAEPDRPARRKPGEPDRPARRKPAKRANPRG